MEGAEPEADHGMPAGAGGSAAGGRPWFARLSPRGRIAVIVAVLVVVAAAIAVPLAVGGGSGGGYPASVRANFLRACETNASTSLCKCALQKIERQVSFHRFAADEASYERTGKLPSYYRSVVLACLKR